MNKQTKKGIFLRSVALSFVIMFFIAVSALFSQNTNDNTSPYFLTFSPTGESVSTNPSFSMRFSENVYKGSGSIYISNETDGTTIEVPLTNVSLSNSNASFTLSTPLFPNKEYAVLIANKTFIDYASNEVIGIYDAYTWSFNTVKFPEIGHFAIKNVSGKKRSLDFEFSVRDEDGDAISVSFEYAAYGGTYQNADVSEEITQKYFYTNTINWTFNNKITNGNWNFKINVNAAGLSDTFILSNVSINALFSVNSTLTNAYILNSIYSNENDPITFVNIPNNAKIKVYTISGVFISEINADSSGYTVWETKNALNESLAKGIYLCYIYVSNESIPARVMRFIIAK